ncbi:ketopantoate reductase family protein [Goodfellowiella coeruleoviolacea]|uniref:ketopantoate reductase family protein n=1 Tax=Goodfellowiella coeruleoviolacea TaxID=334858 RepID=UPI0020A2C40D|nr:2-dehydropantoate 2-reductase N-terminal domain-containing protein [Goodfellowiella coeruleoviolacea]
MRVLVVGGGALGQVFGLRLAQAGGQVSYLVKPGQSGWQREGRVVYRLRRTGPPVARRLVPERVFTSPAETAGQDWDAVWLCVPSTVLTGPWVDELRDHVGAATVVLIGQDSQDLPTLRRVWPVEQIVQAVPTLLAYAAPLADEPLPEPGIAHWVPPGAAVAVSGARERVDPVVRALRRGGLRARNAGPVGTGDALAALMVPHLAALEIADWSVPALLANPRPGAAAAREATAVVAALHGRRPPAAVVTAPWLASLAFRLLPVLAPFDVPRYLRAHFTKVAAQNRLMLDGWIAAGRARGLPVDQLRRLRQALPAVG